MRASGAPGPGRGTHGVNQSVARTALQSALAKSPEGRNRLQQWIVTVFSRIGYHKTLAAIANKHARIIWALLVKGEALATEAVA